MPEILFEYQLYSGEHFVSGLHTINYHNAFGTIPGFAFPVFKSAIAE